MRTFCSDAKWKTVFNGENGYKFENFGFSMMIGRLSRKFKKDSATLETCINEANMFCEKYESILKSDLAKLAD